jgi:DNA-binding MarR family transcriptional regulator
MKKEEIKLYTWVIKGHLRKRIIKALDKPKISSEIAREIKSEVSSVSNCINLFIENGLIKCLNPKDNICRLYELTKKGKDIKGIFRD